MVKCKAIILAVVVFLLLTVLPSCESKPIKPASKPIDTYIVGEMDKQSIPGLSAAIIKQGRVAWSNGYGYANKDSKTSFTADTVINIASVSKTILGCSLMIASEKGIVDLDADINTYLKGFQVKNPYDNNFTVTLHKLATHTAGINDRNPVYGDTYYPGKDSPVSLGEFLKAYISENGGLYDKENFLDVSKGSYYQYSNIGAALAAHALECATGQTYPEFTRDHIFKPLKMDHTSWFIGTTDMRNHAMLYVEDGTAVPPYGLTTYPDGGLRTSANDLARFLAMVANDGVLDDVKIIQKDSVEEMLRNHLKEEQKPQGQPVPDEGIFWQADVNHPAMMGHTGGDIGVCTYMSLSADRKTGLLVLINSSADDSKTIALRNIINRLWEFAYSLN